MGSRTGPSSRDADRARLVGDEDRRGWRRSCSGAACAPPYVSRNSLVVRIVSTLLGLHVAPTCSSLFPMLMMRRPAGWPIVAPSTSRCWWVGQHRELGRILLRERAVDGRLERCRRRARRLARHRKLGSVASAEDRNSGALRAVRHGEEPAPHRHEGAARVLLCTLPQSVAELTMSAPPARRSAADFSPVSTIQPLSSSSATRSYHLVGSSPAADGAKKAGTFSMISTQQLRARSQMEPITTDCDPGPWEHFGQMFGEPGNDDDVENHVMNAPDRCAYVPPSLGARA